MWLYRPETPSKRACHSELAEGAQRVMPVVDDVLGGCFGAGLPKLTGTHCEAHRTPTLCRVLSALHQQLLALHHTLLAMRPEFLAPHHELLAVQHELLAVQHEFLAPYHKLLVMQRCNMAWHGRIVR